MIEKTKLSGSGTRTPFLEAAKAHGSSLSSKTKGWIVRKNLGCLEFHCDAFGIPERLRRSRAFLGFADIVQNSEYGSVEVSVKVEDGVAHAARFNLFCQPSDKAAFASTIMAFFDDVALSESISLNTAPIRNMLEAGIDWSRVSRMVCGIDLRSERRLSRLKIWFFADNELDRIDNPVNCALTADGGNPLFRSFHLHPALLFGYDLRFDGTTALKLYPDITEIEFASSEIQLRLASAFSTKALEAMQQCHWTHLYLSSRNKDTMLQMHPREPDEFLASWLPHPLALDIHRTYANCPLLDMVVSLPAKELERRAPWNFTLYYMPAEVPPGFSVIHEKSDRSKAISRS